MDSFFSFFFFSLFLFFFSVEIPRNVANSKLLLVPKLKRTRMYAKQRTWNTERFEIS